MTNTANLKISYFVNALLYFALGLFVAAMIACPFLFDDAELLWR